MVKVIEILDASGTPRADKDPMVLRWSGMPADLEFEPVDLPPQDHQLVDVFWTSPHANEPVFTTYGNDAGFTKTLERGRRHYLRIGTSSDEGHSELVIEVLVDSQGSATVAVRSHRRRTSNLASNDLQPDREGDGVAVGTDVKP